MFQVVGCRSCGELWIREGEAKTATCPRCQKRFPVEKLRTLAEAETVEAAREARSRLLADRAEQGNIVAGYLETEADGVTRIDLDAYLDAQGLDTEAIAQAGVERTTTPSDRTIVLQLVDELERPTADRIVSHATDRGVDAETAKDLLDQLHRGGALAREDDTYRRL